jgi:H+/Cl- antiporter ClcA
VAFFRSTLCAPAIKRTLTSIRRSRNYVMRKGFIALIGMTFISLGICLGLWLIREWSVFYLIWFVFSFLSGWYYRMLYKKVSFWWRVTLFPFLFGSFVAPIIWWNITPPCQNLGKPQGQNGGSCSATNLPTAKCIRTAKS